jgi:hypothetical protein
VDEQIQALGGKSSWFDGYSETRIYMTHQEPEDVVAFYRQSMPQNGWRERSNTPGKRWGRTKWEMETCNVQLLTGTVGGETMFILGCGGVSAKKIPTAIPALAEGITMHQAFELLRQKSGVGGLAFYGYQAFSVDSQGQSIHFTISGYSPAQKKFCYLNSDVNDIQLHCRDQASIDAPIVSDLATLKGSPEMVREAFAKYAPCPDEKLNLAVNLTQAQAQFLCVAAHWSGEISPYK